MYKNILGQMKDSFKDTDLIIVTDREGKVMYYNNFNDILNKISSQDAIGKSIFELYPWLTKENSTIFRVMETGEPLVNHVQNIKLDEKNSIYALNSAFPLINEQGIIGAIEVSTNLTNESKPLKHKSQYSNFNAKYRFDDFITNDPKLSELLNMLKSVSQNSSNIFIYGETGTGKEIIAHAIHDRSSRRSKPFVAQNCAAIPATIMESLLFGSTKGSYTGAGDKPGLFEIANGGTLYLDEINSMPIELQPKLLRVIEDNAVRRIGDNRDICIDIRIIASTNEKPTKILEEKKMRTDLFFRLNVISAEISALRDRKGDIDVLLDHFIASYNSIFNKNVVSIDSKAKQLLYQYQWPGNVREFKNCIESAFNIVDNNTMILKNHIPDYILSNLNISSNTINIDKTLPALLDEYEKDTIEKILIKNRFNVLRTAKELGIPRQTLYYKLAKYNLA
ncbi:MAG: hypothetical protein APF77_07055 [Clostridia bacterium BRH_c25]|nr:MAG: hypothetical protein APF77_07055 [Clostridia bacterium BRH_c25]